MKKIAIFASGSGTNAQNIISFFKEDKSAEVSLVLSNNPNAIVLERARRHQVQTFVFDREQFVSEAGVLKTLQSYDIDFVVLAGFLWKIGLDWLELFPNNIINIHPALLPMYGGKGMYGYRVHQEVKRNHEKETGITIHYVNEAYDRGQIIFQAKVNIDVKDTPDIIASKVQSLEYANFPKVIQSLLYKDSN